MHQYYSYRVTSYDEMREGHIMAIPHGSQTTSYCAGLSEKCRVSLITGKEWNEIEG